MMEHDMKAVIIGTKGKTEVLETCLRQMKACFLDARVNKVKLFEAMAVFFDRSNTSEQHIVGDVVRRCGLRQESDMVLRQKTDGKFMVGCLGYPQCRNAVWLPGCILEAVVTQDICSICTPGPVFKIRFKFRRLSIPPNFDAEHLGCVGGCDDTLKQLAEICGTGSRNSSSIPARGGHTTPSASAQQSNRGGAIQHLPLVPSEAILDRKLLVYTVGKQGIHQMIAPHKHPIGVLLSPNPSPMKLTDKMEYPPFLVIPVVLPVLYEPPTLQKIGAESSTLASPENAIFSYGRKMP